MKKLLVYLDQHIVSDMAKQLGGAVKEQHAERGLAVGRLYVLLSQLVDEDKIVCPRSTVHDQETGFDSRLAGPIHRVVHELAGDTSFRVYREIEFDQTVRALRRYMRVISEPEGHWRHAYYRDPHRPLERPRVYIRIPDPPWFVADDRRRRQRIHVNSQQQAEARRKHPRAPLADIRASEIRGVAQQVYVCGLNDATQPPNGWRLLHEYARLTGRSDWRGRTFLRLLWPSLLVGGMPLRRLFLRTLSRRVARKWGDDRYGRFFLSPEFDKVPYYDIWCSMWAGFS